ncbi:MAG: iron ABC transporter permease [Brumimicrobium sp.]|nr:iron ABC transporter permease [Brumimicrobium sp.]
MKSRSRYLVIGNLSLGILLIILFFIDLKLGSVNIAFDDILNGLFNYDSTSTEELTVRIFRFPRVLTAVLAGSALAVSGLLMQTLFQNPLAGPYVLGINSGSGLMVALATMTGIGFLSSNLGLVASALLGALLAGAIILICSIYVKNRVSLLLVGIMFGSFTGALISVIQSYSNPDDLKVFMLWSFGSLQNVSPDQLGILSGVVIFGILLTVFLIKPLNILILGEVDARFLGVKVKATRVLIIFVTALLVGTTTAYCGPIAFAGLIVPNIVKLIYRTSDHFHLITGSILAGAVMILVCDMAMQIAQPYIHIPLNALTAIIGAPVVVWIILKRF